MKKRILSVLLCLALMVGVLPMGLFTITASATECSKVTNITCEYNSDKTQLTFSWDAVSGASKYHLYLYETGKSMEVEYSIDDFYVLGKTTFTIQEDMYRVYLKPVK